MDFLRKCPGCGRRFTVSVEKKTLVDTERDVERHVHYVSTYPPTGKVLGAGGAPVVTQTEEDIPIERESFQVQYTCKHCHHEWSETLSVVHKV